MYAYILNGQMVLCSHQLITKRVVGMTHEETKERELEDGSTETYVETVVDVQEVEGMVYDEAIEYDML